MKIIIALAALCAIALSGCQTPSSNATVSALQNPNNEAKAVQAAVTLAATTFLANKGNVQYSPEVVAVADALAVLAAGNPQNLTVTDIAGLVAAAKASAATAGEITAELNAALGLFNSSFAINFPTLKPSYNVFLLAVANGLKQATGGTATALPVIPWPPAAATAR
jgi:outer membrane lipoprotein SlyB